MSNENKKETLLLKEVPASYPAISKNVVKPCSMHVVKTRNGQAEMPE